MSMSAAAKITGNQASDVNERRLRPIYDSLDLGDNKKALQEADRLLKKQKDLLCAKALKTLALIRLNRNEEALSILDEVRLSKPVDDVTLQATSMCFRELQRLDYMVEMYENAAKVKPDSEDMLTHLFMSYVRVNNFKKQQQTAMLLHKLRPLKNPYYFWSVMSIYMQANDNMELGAKVLLPLAEKMILKYVNDNKIEAEAEVQLYLMILKSLGKYEECLKEIQGPLVSKIFSDKIYLDNLELEMLEKVENWLKMIEKCQSLIISQPDQWSHYINYFQSSFQHSKKLHDQMATDNILEEMSQFLNKVLNPLKNKRTFFLVKLEFSSKLFSNKILKWNQVFEGETVLSLLKEFCDLFGNKPVCFRDIQTYLKLLDEQEQKEFTNYLKRNDDLEPNFDTLEMLQRHQLYHQVNHYLGFNNNLTTDEQSKFVTFLCACYQDGLKLGAGYLTTDIQPADFYVILAAKMLYNLSTVSGKRHFHVDAINILELAKTKSPSNFQIKFLLIILYLKLGAFGPCINLIESLDIKHIQYDTLGYSILKHATSFGNFKQFEAFNQATLSFHNNTFKEVSDYIIAAYKYGTFTKIEEFSNFRDRLHSSYVYAHAVLNKLLNNLMIANSEKDLIEVLDSLLLERFDVENISTSTLIDNRDFNVVPSWLPFQNQVNDDLVNSSFQCDKFCIEMRSLILKCLLSLLRLIFKRSISNGVKKDFIVEETNPQILVNNIQKLKEFFGRDLAFAKYNKECIYVTMQQDFNLYKKLNLSKFLFIYFDFFLTAFNYSDLNDEACISNGEVNDNYDDILNQIDDNLNDSEIFFETMSLICEHVCHVAIILHCCYIVLKPMKVGTGKKNKRKVEESSIKIKLLENYIYLTSLLVKFVQSVLLKLTLIQTKSISTLMESLIHDDSLKAMKDEYIAKKTQSEIETSLRNSINDFQTKLNLKLTFLQSIML